jgi:hypothetical protein
VSEAEGYDLQTLSRQIPRELSKHARLFNHDHSTVAKLFGRKALYIPVAIADSDAGRETVYELPLNEKTLMGIYVTDQLTMYKDYLTRLSDEEYESIKETVTGEVLFSGRGKLEILDERVGAGEIVFESELPENQAAAARVKKCTCRRRWYVWSLIATEDCECTGGRPGVLDLLA